MVSSALVCNACRFPDALPDHMSRVEHAISNFAPKLCVLAFGSYDFFSVVETLVSHDACGGRRWFDEHSTSLEMQR